MIQQSTLAGRLGPPRFAPEFVNSVKVLSGLLGRPAAHDEDGADQCSGSSSASCTMDDDTLSEVQPPTHLGSQIGKRLGLLLRESRGAAFFQVIEFHGISEFQRRGGIDWSCAAKADNLRESQLRQSIHGVLGYG